MGKKLLSILLALCLVLGLLPQGAFAIEAGTLAEPQVTGLTVSFDGGESVDLLGDQPTISMPAGSKPIFTVTFDRTDLLSKVFVTSTKDGETKYLEATLRNGQYVTDGLFDPSDTNYIPGTIEVTYSKKSVKVDESGNIGGTDLNALKTQLNAQGVSSRNEAIAADGTVTAQVVLGDMFGAMADEYFDASISEFNAGVDVDESELDKWLGVYQNLSQLSSYDLEGADGKKFTLYLGDGKDFGDSDTYLVMVKDITSNKYTRALLQKAANMANLGDISDAMDAAKLTSGKLLEYRAISKDTAVLREEIAAHPTMTEQEKLDANEKITALDRDRRLFLIGMTAVSVLTNPVGTPLMISALMAGYSSIADYFWDYRIGMIKGSDPIEDVFTESSDHPGWSELTDRTIQESGNYFLTGNLGGLAINENARVTLCLHGQIVSGITIKSGATLRICDCKYKEHGDGSVTGGMISRTISMKGQNELTLEQGVIQGNYGHAIVSEGSGGKITVNGGMVEGVNGAIIADDGGSGEITINSGILKSSGSMGTGIRVNNSEVTINGGTVICSGGHIVTTFDPNGNSNAKVQINGGVLAGNIRTNVGYITVNMRQGSISGNISGGIVLFQKGTCIGNISGSDVTITNGEINGQVHGTNVIIEDGSISGASFSSGASAVINGGTIHGTISNYRDSKLVINGGTVEGKIMNSNTAQLIISNGVFCDGISNYNNKTTLLITENSDIQISGTSAFDNNPIVSAGESYHNGVTYYSSVNAQGVKMTIQEAAGIDFSQPYVRLVADGVTSGPGTGEDCEHIYTSMVIAPTCTERGYVIYTCSKCGNSYQDSYTNALNHSYGEWVVVKEATSTTSGTRERTCSVCQHKETSAIPATGGSGGGTTGGGSSGSVSTGSNSSTSISTILPVTTNTTSQGGTRTTETTVIPTATTKGDTATITVNSTTGNEIVKQAEKNKSDNVVIAPEIKGTVNKTEVTIPASTVGQIGSKTNASLMVSTPVANVTIPNGGLGSLSSAGGTVTITSEKIGNTVELSVKTGGQTVENIPGGMILTVPVLDTTPGTVAVLVHEDGSKEVVRKSVACNKGVTIPLGGSAKLEIVDNSKQFADVPSTSWAADAIAFASSHELFNGSGENRFSPDLPMSRGMLAVVLHNLESNPDQALTGVFSDVDNRAWYAKGVIWAASNGIVSGYGNGQFGPNNSIIREQLAVMLWRYAGSPAAISKELNFNDADKASGYALDALCWAVENGIINGKGGGILDPKGFATRAQVAQMLKNYLER